MHAIETRTAAADYDAIVRRLGGKSGGSPLPLPSSVYRRETMGATDAQIRELSAAWPAARHHTLAPRVFDPVGVRLAETEETDCECVGHEGVTVCERCNNTLTVDAHVDPYDPLRSLSESCAREAVRIACWMVLPVWEAGCSALKRPLRELPRRLLEGREKWNEYPAKREMHRRELVSVEASQAWHAVDAWAASAVEPTITPHGKRDCRHQAIACAVRAGLDLARWYARVRACLPIRDAASAEIERD